MKWYYWALAIVVALSAYEMLKKIGRPRAKKILIAAGSGLRRATAWCVVRMMRILRAMYERLLPPADEGPYAPLTATESADEHGVYEDFLLRGQARPDVLNIALTGPYGSGKSSIIRTFIRRHPEYRYLHISLAAVSPETDSGAAAAKKNLKAEGQDPPKTGAAPEKGVITTWTPQLSEQIEYSILQQMFYHVREQDIPFSRFKRVRGTSRLSLLLLTVAMFGLLLAASYLFIFANTNALPQHWANWLTIHDDQLRPLSWLTLLAATLAVIYYALRLYRNAQLIKVNLHSAQLEIAPKRDTSALNKHLDEILYFFAEVPIDIVVIEDLDRFQIPEIFVKLREINALINHAMEVARKVTFLYALRDDVFTNADRTKFFDLIAPVIPVTNASNAAAMLNREISRMGLPRPIPATFLNDLGFFIQDARLLLNITNELRIYQAQLKGFEINYTHLLAIIVYKNKYPTDFSDLQYNKGMVYEHFRDRPSYLQKILDSQTARRKELTAQLEQIKQTHFKSIEELRTLYLAALYREIFSKGAGFNGKINIGPWNKHFQEMIEDANFNTLRNTGHIHYQDNSSRQRNSLLTFEDIEKLVSPQTYHQRAEALAQVLGHNQQLLEKELEQVNQRIRDMRSYTMQEIMSTMEMRKTVTPVQDHPLLVYLIAGGYLNETYSYYLSQFTEGEITQKDFDFIWSVKHRKKLPWAHPLDKLAAMMKRLDAKEFSYQEMLNFDMAAYLVTDGKSQAEILGRFMGLFKTLDKQAVLFIDQYIEKGKAIAEMVRTLCAHVPGLWRFIQLQSNYTPDKINQYLRLIIQHADTADLVTQNEKGLLAKYMAGQSFLLHPEAVGIDTSILQAACDALKVQFDLPAGETAPAPEMIEYIHDHNRYVFNPRMISLLLTHLMPDYDEATFLPQQYTKILQSDLHSLKAYIDEHFEQFILKVFLQIKTHDQESEETMLKVLNADSVTIETKKRVVSDTGFLLTNIGDCHNMRVWDTLMEHARIEPTWANIFKYYNTPLEEEDNPAGLTNSLASFLNIPATAAALGEQRITAQEGDQELAVMLAHICTSGHLTDEALSQYLRSMAFQMTATDFRNISFAQAQMLIGQNKVAFGISTFNSLKQRHPALAASWAVDNWTEYTKIFDELELTTPDWNYLLKEPRMQEAQRSFLLGELPDDQVVPLLELGVAIADETLDIRQVPADYNTLRKLAGNPRINRNSVVLLLIPNLDQVENEQVRAVLSDMGGEFATLADGQVQVRVQKSDIMEQLLGGLQAGQRLVASFEIKNKYIHVQLHTTNNTGT